jgi:hypothetical protein
MRGIRQARGNKEARRFDIVTHLRLLQTPCSALHKLLIAAYTAVLGVSRQFSLHQVLLFFKESAQLLVQHTTQRETFFFETQ